MRLLLNQNLSAAVAEQLRTRGFDAVHTREVGLAAAADQQILEWCRLKRRMIVTRDADFHALLALSGAKGPSVIRIRIESLSDDELTTILLTIITTRQSVLDGGAVITVKADSVRIRRLPILRTETKPEP
jgi:predicted nuclease of predicted toxin-antitoxin system